MPSGDVRGKPQRTYFRVACLSPALFAWYQTRIYVVRLRTGSPTVDIWNRTAEAFLLWPYNDCVMLIDNQSNTQFEFTVSDADLENELLVIAHSRGRYFGLAHAGWHMAVLIILGFDFCTNFVTTLWYTKSLYIETPLY